VTGKENKQDSNHQHPFDRIMFGAKREPSNVEDKTPSTASTTEKTPSTPSTTEQFDFMNLIQSVDQLMGSVNKFKPMVKQFAPLLDLFKTKK
jgi:hypothetical protein